MSSVAPFDFPPRTPAQDLRIHSGICLQHVSLRPGVQSRLYHVFISACELRRLFFASGTIGCMRRGAPAAFGACSIYSRTRTEERCDSGQTQTTKVCQ
jgi:hypothetical protein